MEQFCAEEGVVVQLYNISSKLTAPMLEGWLESYATTPTKLIRGKHAYVGAKPSKTAFIQLESHAAAKELVVRPAVRMRRRYVYITPSSLAALDNPNQPGVALVATDHAAIAAAAAAKRAAAAAAAAAAAVDAAEAERKEADDAGNPLLCDCGRKAAERVVTKGTNIGRTYFNCDLQWQDVSRCKFFAFADEIAKGQEEQRKRQASKVKAEKRLKEVQQRKLLDDQRDQERRARRRGTFGFGGGGALDGDGAAALATPATPHSSTSAGEGPESSSSSSRKLRDLRHLKAEIEEIVVELDAKNADESDGDRNGGRANGGGGAAAAACGGAAGTDGDAASPPPPLASPPSSQSDSAKKRTHQTRRQGWKCAQGPFPVGHKQSGEPRCANPHVVDLLAKLKAGYSQSPGLGNWKAMALGKVISALQKYDVPFETRADVQRFADDCKQKGIDKACGAGTVDKIAEIVETDNLARLETLDTPEERARQLFVKIWGFFNAGNM